MTKKELHKKLDEQYEDHLKELQEINNKYLEHMKNDKFVKITKEPKTEKPVYSDKSRKEYEKYKIDLILENLSNINKGQFTQGFTSTQVRLNKDIQSKEITKQYCLDIASKLPATCLQELFDNANKIKEYLESK